MCVQLFPFQIEDHRSSWNSDRFETQFGQKDTQTVEL